MISDFYKTILKNTPKITDGRIIFHPQFKKKRITTFPDGAYAISEVPWNYELEERWKKNSKLVCYDENNKEILYEPYEPESIGSPNGFNRPYK